MRVYKILTTPQLEALRAEGSTLGAPIDLRDGYVHLSAEDQVAGTLALHFQGQSGLWVLGVDADALGDALRWEPSRGGALFPHLYGPLPLSAVRSVVAVDDPGVTVPGRGGPQPS
jgi:uncharacterized protein (DUF952 family)